MLMHELCVHCLLIRALHTTPETNPRPSVKVSVMADPSASRGEQLIKMETVDASKRTAGGP